MSKSSLRRRRPRCRAVLFLLTALVVGLANAPVFADEEVTDGEEAAEESSEEEPAAPPSESSASGDASVTLAPGQGLRIRSADDAYALQVRGIFQGHYEYETTGGQPDHNSFFLRLLRVDAQGHAFTEDLTFRLMPELARQASLLDGWVSYRFTDGFQLRGGQFNIPFNWERHSPPTRHQFGDRTVANNEFQWPTGRDLGLMAHGDPADQIRYGVGIFSGQGINARRSDSEGLMASGRLVYTPVGEYATSEVPVEAADDFNLSIGAGALYALRNGARDWADWDPVGAQRADVVNTTADVGIRWSRLSTHLTGFYRHVTPDAPEGADELPADAQPETLERFDGFGFGANTAVLIIPERLTGIVRYSEAQPNRETDLGRQRELLGGVHLFHRGLDSRFQLQAGVESEYEDDDWRNDFVANLQYQFIF